MNKNLIKRIGIFLVVFLFTLQMYPSLLLSNRAFANEINDFPFITDISLSDEGGNSYDLSEKNFNKNDKIRINFNFKIKAGEKINNGEKYKINIPDEFNINSIKDVFINAKTKYSNQNGDSTTSSAVKENYSEDSHTKISITKSDNSNELVVEFESLGRETSGIDGGFYIDAEYNADKIGDAEFKTISFSANNETIKSFNIKFADDKVIDFPFITGVYLSADKFEGDIDIGKDEFKDNYASYLEKLKGLKLEKDSQMFIGYTFKIPQDQKVEAGEKFILDYPKEFTTQRDMSQEIIATDGSEIGTVYFTKDNKVTMIFSDQINTYYSDIEGNFWFGTALNKAEIGKENSVNITFKTPYLQDKTFNINFRQEPFKEEEPKINKSGEYSHNDQTINWKIEATTGNLDRNNFTILDELDPKQHTYISGSLKIDGIPVEDSNFADNKLNYNFGTVSKNEKKTIEFKTKPNDYILNVQGKSNSIINKATLKIDNKSDISVSKTVKIENSYISKSGSYNSSTKSIDWTIDVNKNKVKFSNPVVKDEIPEGLILKTDSVTLDGQRKTLKDYSYDASTRVFIYKLPSDNLNHTIKFSTLIDSSIIQDTFINTHTFNNIVQLDVNDGQHFEFSAPGVSVGTNKDILSKELKNYDSATKEITWQINVNKIGISIKNAKVKEFIDSNHEYVENSLSVSNNPSATITEVVSKDPKNHKEYEISLGDINSSQTITLKTKIINDKIIYNNKSSKIENSCKLIGDNIKTCQASASKSFNNTLITKDGSYNYNTREITWIISVNSAKIPIQAAKVVDNINKGQEYVDNSFKIEHIAGNSDVVAPSLSGFSYSQTDSGDKGQGGVLSYDFGGSISDSYKITFKTKISSDLEFNQNTDKKLTNKAKLETSSTNQDITASKDITIKNYLVSKDCDYTKGNDFITWKININKNNVSLGGIKITDTLPDGLQIDMDSVHLYEVKFNSNGSESSKTEISPSDYSTSYNPNSRDFVLEYSNSANKSYLITFDTSVKTPGKSFLNTVKLESENSGNISTSHKESDKVYYQEGISGGGASLNSGSILITKVDKNTNIPLAGAQFELLRNGESIQISEPTNKDGKAKFKKIAFGKEYTIKEIKAPYGYTLSDEEYKFTINKSNVASENEKQYTFKDEKYVKNIEFLKNGEDDKVLKGAEFSLYKADDTNFKNPLKTAISDENGLVRFEGVELGHYKIKETIAPEGYLLSNQIIDITLDGTGKSGDTIKADPYVIKNDLIKKSIQLYKKSNLNQPLAGAAFSLYKENDTEFKNPLQTQISDIQGLVVFKDVPYGNYIIKETAAPVGYVINNIKITATVDNTNNSYDIIKANPYEIENETCPLLPTLVIKDITLIKKSSDDKVLKEAEFSLYKADDTNFTNPLKTATSDENGLLRFEKVEPGNYVIKETKAPKGYEMSDNTINIIEGYFVDNEITTIDVGTVTNVKIKETSHSGHTSNNSKNDSDSGSDVDNNNTSTDNKVDIGNNNQSNNTSTYTSNKLSNNSGIINENPNITQDNTSNSYLEPEEIPVKDSNSNNKKQAEKLPQAGGVIDFSVLIGLGSALIVLGFALKLKKKFILK